MKKQNYVAAGFLAASGLLGGEGSVTQPIDLLAKTQYIADHVLHYGKPYTPTWTSLHTKNIGDVELWVADNNGDGEPLSHPHDWMGIGGKDLYLQIHAGTLKAYKGHPFLDDAPWLPSESIELGTVAGLIWETSKKIREQTEDKKGSSPGQE